MNRLGSCSSESNLLKKNPLIRRKKSLSESYITTALEPVEAPSRQHSMPDLPPPESFPNIGGRLPSPPHAKAHIRNSTVGPNALRMLKRWRRRSLERRKKIILAEVNDRMKVPPKLPDQNKKPALLSRRRCVGQSLCGLRKMR